MALMDMPPIEQVPNPGGGTSRFLRLGSGSPMVVHLPRMPITRQLEREWKEAEPLLKRLSERHLVVVMDTPARVCIDRILADPERRPQADSMIAAVKRWR